MSLEVYMQIADRIVEHVSVQRMHPTNRLPEDDEICDYKVTDRSYGSEFPMRHKYGDRALSLAADALGLVRRMRNV